MVVQHNLTAMNSNRMLGLTSSAQAKSTEKLSSGYKINRAADDASGLAISEKMRKQIRGLTQASANAQDGISAVQTAEGALTEVHDMLQRMNELAVKAANGTQSVSDRTAIQAEVDQLSTEIDRVAETTKFNETYLLKGDKDPNKVKGYSYSYGTVDEGAAATIKGHDGTAGVMTDTASGVSVTVTFNDDTIDATAQNEIAVALREQGITVSTLSEWDAEANGGDGAAAEDSYTVALTGSVADKYKIVDAKTEGQFEIQDAYGNLIATLDLTDTELKSKAAKAGDVIRGTVNLTAGSVTAAAEEKAKVQYYDADGNAISENALGNYFGMPSGGTAGTDEKMLSGVKLYDAVGNVVVFEDGDKAGVVATQDQTATLRLSLHVGADATSNNQISLNLDAMTAKGLGVNGLKIDGTDDTNALKAIETIKAAITKVSAQRSDLGAIQNRLEHTINNLDNVVENTTSAESAIRDTDMATEMVQYSNQNILAQAGQAMLAQANQSNQGVLSLLG